MRRGPRIEAPAVTVKPVIALRSMSVVVAVTGDDVFDGIRSSVCEGLRAFLDLVCASLGCVAKIVRAFAHMLGS